MLLALAKIGKALRPASKPGAPELAAVQVGGGLDAALLQRQHRGRRVVVDHHHGHRLVRCVRVVGMELHQRGQVGKPHVVGARGHPRDGAARAVAGVDRHVQPGGLVVALGGGGQEQGRRALEAPVELELDGGLGVGQHRADGQTGDQQGAASDRHEGHEGLSRDRGWNGARIGCGSEANSVRSRPPSRMRTNHRPRRPTPGRPVRRRRPRCRGSGRPRSPAGGRGPAGRIELVQQFGLAGAGQRHVGDLHVAEAAHRQRQGGDLGRHASRSLGRQVLQQIGDARLVLSDQFTLHAALLGACRTGRRHRRAAPCRVASHFSAPSIQGPNRTSARRLAVLRRG